MYAREPRYCNYLCCSLLGIGEPKRPLMADGFKLNLVGRTTCPLLRLGATALKRVDLHENTAPQPVSLLDPFVREIAPLCNF